MLPWGGGLGAGDGGAGGDGAGGAGGAGRPEGLQRLYGSAGEQTDRARPPFIGCGAVYRTEASSVRGGSHSTEP